MAWQYWVFVGTAMVCSAVFAWAACRVAGDADERAERFERRIREDWITRHNSIRAERRSRDQFESECG